MLLNPSRIVWDHWEDIAKRHPEREAIIHWDALGKPFRWSYGDLIDAACSMAGNLISAGIRAGDVCAIIIRHNRHFYPIYMGIAAIGAIPSVLAYPNARLHSDKFIHGLIGMSKRSGLDWVLTEKGLESTVKPLVTGEESSVKGIFYPLDWIEKAQTRDPDRDLLRKSRQSVCPSSPFLLQHSSGTTGLQKAIVLSNKAVVEHMIRYSNSIRLSENDKVVSWLPLYHDMGMIAAFHMPLLCGIPSIQIDPFQWISAPVVLFQAISEEKATLTWQPNFAYNLTAERIYDEDMAGIELDSMRMFINCSEVVRYESHGKFISKFGRYGVKRESIAACYAMAETTFAVTQTQPDSEAATISVDRDHLGNNIVKTGEGVINKRTLVSSGRLLEGCLLKIADDAGRELSEEKIGNVLVRSASLFDGYRKDPDRTRKVFIDGWYKTGDIGFIYKKECYILGRGDDIMIIAGKNIFPEDIENIVNNTGGVMKGRVVAFGIDDITSGTQEACVVAEISDSTEEEKRRMALEIKQAGIDIDVTIRKVYFVPGRWLIKSSSGKLSRRANKERVLKEGLSEVSI